MVGQWALDPSIQVRILASKQRRADGGIGRRIECLLLLHFPYDKLVL